MNIPRKINLGSGKDWREDCLNIDVNPYWKPDLLADLNLPFAPFGPADTARFGQVALGEGMFTEILANDVLEHLTNLAGAMTCCLKLLADGGLFRITVPYDLSHGAWQDPTHVRAFNERSFSYYTECYWYMGWTESRFDLAELRFAVSDLGRELQGRGLPPEEVVRTPRAVDALNVVLKKRPLTPEEQEFGQGFLRRPPGAG